MMWGSHGSRVGAPAAKSAPAPTVSVWGGDQSEGESHAELVEQIKVMQRTDEYAKTQWAQYCNTSGEGKRDPRLHGEEFLSTFILQYNAGALNDSPGVVGAYAEEPNLAESTKLLQKKSPVFKTAWAQYCAEYGKGTNDPSKHDPSYLIKFYEYLAQQATMTSQVKSWTSPGTQQSWGGAQEQESWGPPAKRMRTGVAAASYAGNGGGYGHAGGFDAGKEQLVQTVKAFQKSCDEAKEVWGAYADAYLGGVRDPNRHDAPVLQEFCTTNNIDPSNPGAIAQYSAAGGSGGAVAEAGGEKEHYVQQIKAYQKSGEWQKESWAQFAGGKRDPARHPIEKLQEFCRLQGL